MNFTPNLRIWEAANLYQDAASLCNEHGQGWPAAINAALAMEIYLKSFLSETIKIRVSNDLYQCYQKTKRGHKLLDIYKLIPSDVRHHLCEQYNLLKMDGCLIKDLNKYNDVFFNARYMYEKESIKVVDNNIVYVSALLREAVFNVAKILHPKFITPNRLPYKE
ncbi:hypothetical protein JD507_01510 [Aeromonas jandaei]|uniref:hypothetical protein n=1 Tax=Aeromonas jandaei TaxID=650 RepID=UPI00191CDE2F|nr:hypothetical protein [Aeromonas jandaei]MBL0543900.1 hypothetical protein [Aeromonas jandaei]